MASDASKAAESHERLKKKSKKRRRSEKPLSNTSNDLNIDEIFGDLQAKKKKKRIEDMEQKAQEKLQEEEEAKAKAELKQHIANLEAQNSNTCAMSNGRINPQAKPIRYDEDGIAIYTEESLCINQGGGSKDCPFDCWCCF